MHGVNDEGDEEVSEKRTSRMRALTWVSIAARYNSSCPDGDGCGLQYRFHSDSCQR